MGADPLDLTGQWHGDFAYSANQGPTTPFVALTDDRFGHLSGTISEHDQFSGTIIEAVLAGTRSGSFVDFTKVYSASAAAEYANPVDYVGAVSSDSQIIMGLWSLLDWDGTFEMRRDTIADYAEALLRAEGVMEPAIPPAEPASRNEKGGRAGPLRVVFERCLRT
jgi:hypothetical protein